MKCFLYVCVILSFLSCSSQEYMMKEIRGYESRKLRNGQKVEFSNINFVELNSGNGRLLSPRKILLDGNSVFVQEKEHLLCFSTDGKLKNVIGQRGHGRGEFVVLETFYLESDKTVVLVDSYKGRLLRYGVDGKFKDEIKIGKSLINIHDAYLLGKDSLFVNNYIMEDKRDVYGILNLKTKEMTSVARTKLSTDHLMMPIGRNCFSTYRGNVKYVMPFDDKVYGLDGESYCYVTNRSIFSEEEQENVKNFSLFTYKIDDKNFTGFTDIFETDNYLFTAFSDWEYTLLDKRTNTCRRFNYKLNEDLKSMPLVRIVATYGNQLVGLINTDELKKVKTYNCKDRNLERLMSYKNKKDHYLLVFYDIK